MTDCLLWPLRVEGRRAAVDNAELAAELLWQAQRKGNGGGARQRLENIRAGEGERACAGGRSRARDAGRRALMGDRLRA